MKREGERKVSPDFFAHHRHANRGQPKVTATENSNADNFLYAAEPTRNINKYLQTQAIGIHKIGPPNLDRPMEKLNFVTT